MTVNLDESTKLAIDSVGAAGTIGVVMGYLPQATIVLTFLWAAIRLYETKTVQRWLGKKVASSGE